MEETDLRRGYHFDKRLYKIALEEYSGEELEAISNGKGEWKVEGEVVGFLRRGRSGHYILIPSEKKEGKGNGETEWVPIKTKSGIDLVFKRKDNGDYAITNESYELIFERSADPVEALDVIIDKIQNAMVLTPVLDAREMWNLKMIRGILQNLAGDRE